MDNITAFAEVLFVEHMSAARKEQARQQGIAGVELVIARTIDGEYIAITHGGENGALDYGALNLVKKAREFGFNAKAQKLNIICCHPAQVSAAGNSNSIKVMGDWSEGTLVTGTPNGWNKPCAVTQMQEGEWLNLTASPRC